MQAALVIPLPKPPALDQGDGSPAKTLAVARADRTCLVLLAEVQLSLAEALAGEVIEGDALELELARRER